MNPVIRNFTQKSSRSIEQRKSSVITTRRNVHCRCVNLLKLWTAAYAEAGVPKGTRLFYSVRHNFGTEMANEGMLLPALANLLGHSDVKMTMRYYNMNKKTIDKARDILNRRAMVNS